jgi:hypothetical protein
MLDGAALYHESVRAYRSGRKSKIEIPESEKMDQNDELSLRLAGAWLRASGDEVRQTAFFDAIRSRHLDRGKRRCR